MPDLKISQLPVATTPLAGTELVPIVQGGVTDQTTVQAILTGTVPSGTANGVTYLNGSKVLTSGSALQFNGTNLALGAGGEFQVFRPDNATYTTQYMGAGGTGGYVFDNRNADGFRWLFTGSEQMRLTSTGLGIGTSSPATKLDVNGVVSVAGLPALRSRVFGYSGTFQAIEIGARNSNNGNVALAVDVNAITGGGFLGQNQVIVPANGLLMPNAAGTDFIGVLARDASNRLLLGPGTTGGITSGNVVIDTGGNLGLGVTPSAWSGATAFQAARTSVVGISNNGYLGSNWYFDGSTNRYIATAAASRIDLDSGGFQFQTAPSGTAGNAISFTQAMTLDASGNLGIGTTSTSGLRLTVDSGSAAIVANFNSTSANGNYIRFQNSGTSNGDIGSGASIVSGGALADFGINTRGANNLILATNTTERARITSAGDFITNVNAAAPTLGTNSTMSFELTSNTSLKIVVRGTDGTTRSVSLTLA